MSSNFVVPSSYFNGNTVTFTSDAPGRVKLVGPNKVIANGDSVEGASGFGIAILYWTVRFDSTGNSNPDIYIVQFPSKTWQTGETVTINGPTTSDDGTVFTLTGSQTTTSQPFLLTKYESLSAKQKADIAEAEGAAWWNLPGQGGYN